MTLPLELEERDGAACVVLDLGEHCGLRESLAGYATHLCHPSSLALLRMTGWLIIPGATHIDPSTEQLILASLHHGGTVLLESGAAFGDFPAYRDQLRDHLQIHVTSPVELWPAHGIPYVDYSWPVGASVRDFSRVIPLAPQAGTIIARVGDIPVALARRVGSGTLVFLGSPLGTALWSGDAAAKRWLDSLTPLGGYRQTWYRKM